MFALSMGAGMNLAFPDVCKTPSPAGPVPVPYQNVAMTSTSMQVVSNILIDCMPALNLNSKGIVSNGDEPGAAGGVVDNMVMGQAHYTLGCFTIFYAGAPAQRLGSITAQNAAGASPNCIGSCQAPSQITVCLMG